MLSAFPSAWRSGPAPCSAAARRCCSAATPPASPPRSSTTAYSRVCSARRGVGKPLDETGAFVIKYISFAEQANFAHGPAIDLNTAGTTPAAGGDMRKSRFINTEEPSPCVSSLVGLVLVFLALRQNPSFYWLQFAVDQNEKVYIGTLNSGIKVYEDQEFAGALSFTNRGYSFTIENGTELICASAAGVVHVDLKRDFLQDTEHSIIKTEPVSAANPGYQLYNKEFKGNGHIYRAKVTPCSIAIFDENDRQLLILGDSRWNIALIFAASILAFPLRFGVPLSIYKKPPLIWEPERGTRRDG